MCVCIYTYINIIIHHKRHILNIFINASKENKNTGRAQINKCENPDYYYFFLHPNDDPDHSQNLMSSKLNQDPSSDFMEKSNQ